ncbi:MAG TPA: tRNA adenosine(34) deaminase TadA [Acidobacteriota bacterium]|nr:tRNA adenosine(34) deaminase TadA [Acidobacteriota bacterium]
MTETPSDVFWMEIALNEAQASARQDEVPVGAVLVFDNQLIARSGNRTLRDQDPTAHAEIVTLRAAAQVLGNHRLLDTTLYVTLEPCAMCAGALIQARVKRLVYGASDLKAGAVDSHFGICSAAFLNHRLEITSGLLGNECSQVLQEFFRAKRQAKQAERTLVRCESG